jgi:hypothetical protein
MTKAIVHAAMGLRWEMAATTPDHTIGTLNLRAHQAVVDIAYDTKSYNIRYKSSMGLPYGEADQTSGQETREIHKNYNGWIENLDNAIRTQFIAAGP